MQFFHDGDVPQPLQPLPLPPVGESQEVATATAAIVAVENVTTVADVPEGGSSSACPSFGGTSTLQQQGGTDGSMSSPPPAVTENRTLVVYPPECLLHM